MAGVCTTFLHFECCLVVPGMEGCCEFQMHGKTRTLPLRPVRYIHYFSNRPPVMVLNVVVSQLVPYLNISSTRSLTGILVNGMIDNLCAKQGAAGVAAEAHELTSVSSF